MRWILPTLVLLAAGGFLGGQPAAENKAHLTNSPYASDGTAVDAWLPAGLHMKNVGGSDGAGLCVFTSIEMVARATNIRTLFGFQDWMKKRPGGGWPEKVNDMIDKFCKERNLPKPVFFHVEANDLPTLKKALQSGRPIGITYSYSPTRRYGGQRIAHMVMLSAAGAGSGPDGKGWWCINDNNFPGTWEWMSESQFLSVASGGGRLWACIFQAPTYPPAPLN